MRQIRFLLGWLLKYRKGYAMFAYLYCNMRKYKLNYACVCDKVNLSNSKNYTIGFALRERSCLAWDAARIRDGKQLGKFHYTRPDLFISSGWDVKDGHMVYYLTLNMEDTIYKSIFIPEFIYRELIRGLLDAD